MRQKLLGWKIGGVGEVGKFYDHAGHDNWYYFCYGVARTKLRLASLKAKSKEQPKGPLYNGIVSLATGADVFGDVAVVRSGPVGLGGYDEEFKKEELVQTVDWCARGRDGERIFIMRQRSRFFRDMGLPTAWSDVPGFHLSY